MKRWLSAVLAAALALAVLAAPPALATGLAFSSTPLAGSSGNKIHNVTRAAAAIDGTTLYEGDIFSFNDVVGARTAAGGYRSANNGRGAMVVGGGVAQAATTLYLALTQLGDVEYLDLHTYGAKFADNYVDSGYDAILTDDEVGIDFSFVSLYPGSLTISMWVTDDDVNCLVSLSDDIGDPGDGGMVGSSSTPLYGTDAKIDNVLRAAQALSDVTLQPYDLFSFNDLVGPRTAANGYRKAVNGRGAMVVGGGVAQAASAVYLAIKDLDVAEVLEKKTYGKSFTEYYVDDADDAIAVDYNAGTDFSFRYVGATQLTIYLYQAGDDLVCVVYEA